jgi:hypothetical protein
MRAQSIALSLALLLPPALAQTPSTQPATAPTPSQPSAAAADHQRLLDLLHITELRPGVNHDPKAANGVNYDEAKANPWPNLPDPLVLNNGRPVTSAAMWTKLRRPELVELFDREILGRVPANAPAIHWQVVSTTPGTDGGIATVTKHLVGHADNSAYQAISVDAQVDLVLPATATKPVPVLIEITFEKYPVNPNRPPAAPAPPEPTPTWKQQVLAKGWGYALFYPTTLQVDNGAGLTQGIIGLTNHGQPRKLDDWGALRAWAWGTSRLVDYLETDKAVDAQHIAVEGHSRFGKTALVAMAYEPRFAVAYVNSSGAGGADLARRRAGEQMENIAGTGEYHWMAGNYLKYAELTPKEVTPNDMPVDMHELIALCAPRPVFIGGGTVEGGDGWADVRGTFIAEEAAGPVYSLLGKKPLSDDKGPIKEFPPVGTALIAGDLGFRQHPGGHTPLPDYPTFLTFASRYMTPTMPAK